MMPEARTLNWFCEVPLRRAQRRRKYDCLVTAAECARAQIPDAPLPPPSQGTRLRTSGLSRFLLPTFLCGRQRKVGAPRTGGTLINQKQKKKPPPQARNRQRYARQTNQGKAN